jgi:mxaJ protein
MKRRYPQICRCAVAIALAASNTVGAANPDDRRVLRVCADPNNLPFSNRRGQGFENRVVQILAHEMKANVEYTWWAQRRGYARNTLKAGDCDLWVGVASGVETMQTTQPYYRSTYVFLTRADRHLDIDSFDDPRLRGLRIGVQMIGNNSSNTPPSHALARRGIVDNVRGYMIYGDYASEDPQAPIVRAVERGDLDIAVVWGPLAGYYAKRSPIPMKLTDVMPAFDGPQWPMAFDISVGVRRGEEALKNKVEGILKTERRSIDAILDEYGVPRVRADDARRLSEVHAAALPVE